MNTSKLCVLFSRVLIGTMLIASPVFSIEGDSVSEKQRISVGERADTQSDKESLKEKRARLVQKIECGEDLSEENITLSETERKEISGERSEETTELVDKAIKSTTYYTSHQGCFHNPIAISFLGDTIELEDGSMWGVYSSDRYKTLDWMTGDTIIIVPNDEWFSSFDYKLVNLNTGAKIKVNLSLGPIYNGIYTHWIVAIDYYRNEVVLEDGSFWRMSSFDESVFKKWLPNDTVIIGINDNWLSGANPNILINVNTNNHAMGNCIY